MAAKAFATALRPYKLPQPVLLTGILLIMLIYLSSCSASKNNFNPYKKFSPQQLQQDYALYQNILEERHPSLYWYTPKPVMDKVFAEGRNRLHDSLTEYDFRKIINMVNTNIQCGHTSVKASRQYLKYIDTLKIRISFPLYLKIWNDTVVVTHNAHGNDSLLPRGTMIDSLNGMNVKQLLDTFYHYINADGNNPVAKDQMLSTGTWFGSLYTALYGWKPVYEVAYRDASGNSRHAAITPVVITADSAKHTVQSLKKNRKQTRRQRLNDARLLTIDHTENTALLELNSFSQKLKLKPFFRQSFSRLKKDSIQNLIIDLRSNGGGRVDNSTLLTKFIADKPFKLADSLYAQTRKTRFGRHIQNDFWTRLALHFMTRKKAAGRYHFTYYETHYYKPRKRNHFNGNVFILSGGNSFSASVLVMSMLKSQQNVTIVGEPSGGAAYGNTAWFINEVTLPHTKIRFRLPLMRLVIDKDLPKNGQGVWPDVFAGPTIEAIKNARDYKMEKAKELIRNAEELR